MIGYNEMKEAVNLLELLQRSQKMLQLFNVDDQQIAEKLGVEAPDKTAMARIRVRWYARLAFIVRDWSRSGDYAQCFASADKVVRQPYDLLARLEPQADELEAYEQAEAAYKKLTAAEKKQQASEPSAEQNAEPVAEQNAEPAAERSAEPAAEQNAEPVAEQSAEPVAEQTAESSAEQKAAQKKEPEPTIDVQGFRWLRDTYLEGLAEEDRKRARILYDRLLRIQPMRTLLARLMSLAKNLKDTPTPDASVETAQITLPEEAEKELRAQIDESFRTAIPAWQERKKKASLDLYGHDFTILDRLMDNWDEKLCGEDEFALPGSVFFTTQHVPTLLTAAIVNKVAAGKPAVRKADGAGEDGAAADATDRPQYCAIPGGHTLLGIYDGSERVAPDKFFDGVKEQQKEKQHRLMRVRSYAGLQLLQLTDEAKKQLSSVSFDESAIGKAPLTADDRFCARDGGGRQLAMQLSLGLKAQKKKRAGLDCLQALMKDEIQTDYQRLMAINALKDAAQAYFSKGKLGGGIMDGISNGKNLESRSVERMMACMVENGVQFMQCLEGAVPPAVTEFLNALAKDVQKCEKFAADVKALHVNSRRLNMRFENTTATGHRLCVWSSPESEFEPLMKWRAEAAALQPGQKLRKPDFDTGLLWKCCVSGLKKFIYLGNQVKKTDPPFQLNVAKSVVDVDICFRLACLWVKLMHPGVKICLVCNRMDPEESYFEVGGAALRFVDVIARNAREAKKEARLTPERLWKILDKLRDQTFGLVRKPKTSTTRFELQ